MSQLDYFRATSIADCIIRPEISNNTKNFNSSPQKYEDALPIVESSNEVIVKEGIDCIDEP